MYPAPVILQKQHLALVISNDRANSWRRSCDMVTLKVVAGRDFETASRASASY